MSEENLTKSDAPEILNIQNETTKNNYYRKEIWTGKYLQVTVMCIPPKGEIGLEIHEDTDQFLRIVQGVGTVYMGENRRDVKLVGYANPECAILVPAQTWHNVINEQNVPLKLYSIYAPPHHKKGTIHKTKFDSDLAED